VQVRRVLARLYSAVALRFQPFAILALRGSRRTIAIGGSIGSVLAAPHSKDTPPTQRLALFFAP
jgi:hypothetical protein